MLLSTLIFAQAAASQLAIGVSAPAVVSSCESFSVVVRATAAGHVAPLVTHPSFAPFTLVRRTARPSVTVSAAGDQSIAVEHRYVLTADNTGTFTIAPFSAELGGVVARTRPHTITVQSTPGANVPRIVAEARIDPRLDVNFLAMALPDTVYVGQQVSYEVAVFFDEQVRERLRRSPTFFPPDMQGMLAYDLAPTRGEAPRRRVGGRCYDALVYQRAIFPLQAGRIVIPPAQLAYALPLGLGIFSREESHEARTGTVTVVALDPPGEGRPADDIGAVGDLRVDASLDAVRGRVGDPVTLTVRVAGEANIKLLPRPHVELAWASLVPDAERVTVDSTSARIRGAKEFDWLVTPRRDGAQVVPPITYPHFNPATRAYATATTQQLVLDIESAPLARIDTVVATPRLALRAHYRGPLGAPFYAHPAVWLLAMAAPLPAVAGAMRRRARRTTRVASPAEVLHALAVTPTGPRDVRRAFVAALADRLGLPAGVFTRSGAMERALRRSGVTTGLAREAEDFLRMLDAAAFDGASPLLRATPAMARTAGRIYAEVDAEALARWELGPAVSLVLMLALGATLAATATASPATDALDFARASAQYEAGEYGSAAAGFEQLALREPRAPDAWANYGTAAWGAADTAGAVVGWQRALRLEPAAGDMRERLDAVRYEVAGAPGHVAPVGVTPLAVSALVLWMLACALAFAVTARSPSRRAAMRAAAIAGAVAAALLASSAVVADERLAAGDLVVLRNAGLLSRSPAIGARRDARAETGEVGVAGGREGGWTHVRFDDDRAGWVPSTELASLERAPLRAD